MPYTWAPTTAQVADYVTSRTIDFTTPGSDTPVADFNANTVPNNDQVGRLINGSCAWVLAGLTSPLTTGADVLALAAACAAVRTAGMVEASYPQRDDDINTGKLLLDQAFEMRASLDAANTADAYTNSGPTNPTQLVPIFSFPDPLWYGDRNL